MLNCYYYYYYYFQISANWINGEPVKLRVRNKSQILAQQHIYGVYAHGQKCDIAFIFSRLINHQPVAFVTCSVFI